MRDLVVLGSASAVPTKSRNHNGYLVRWDGHGLLFDPGEGTQRQMIRAGVAAHDLTWICVTHFHGDHCLGVPGSYSGSPGTASPIRYGPRTRPAGGPTGSGSGTRRSSTTPT